MISRALLIPALTLGLGGAALAQSTPSGSTNATTPPASGPSSGTAPGGSGSSGWTGGLGGAYTGTTPDKPTPASPNSHPETATGLDPTKPSGDAAKR